MRNTILIVLASIICAYAQASFAVSFDCTKARSIPEHLICNTPELSKADDELKIDVETARALVIDKQQFAKEITFQWAWREKNCRDVLCVRNWYERQHQELTALIAGLAASNQTEHARRSRYIPSQIVKAYRENSIAADRQFNDEPFALGANVATVGIDDSKQPYIGAFTNYPGVLVKISVPKDEKDVLAKLHQLDAVSMLCDGAGTSESIVVVLWGLS